MEKLRVVVILAALTLLAVSPSWAQTSKEFDDLRQAIEELMTRQKAVQQDLQEIKNLLRTRPAQAPSPSGDEDLQNVTLNVEGIPFKGEKNARLVLIDFTDYQ
jgi:hypothetical protein